MKAKIDANEFKRLINNVKSFVSSDQRMMNYIYLELDAEHMEIKATALDGKTVSIEYAKLAAVDESFKCFIKPNIPKITKYDLYVELELLENKLFCTVGENITGYIQPDGTYFDVNKILEGLKDDVAKTRICVTPEYLIRALKCKRDDYKNYAAIEITDPISPIVIKSTNKNDKSIKLVLPVRESIKDGEKIQPIKTNADKIRAMTDEELVDVLDKITGDHGCDLCPCREDDCHKLCREAFLNWLKEPMEV